MMLIEEIFSLHTENTDQLLHRFGQILHTRASNSDKQKIYQALGIVLVAHSGDIRRRPDKCTDHIIRTTIYFIDIFGYEVDLVITALLHDLIEDNPEFLPTANTIQAQLQYIESEFGPEVTRLVTLLTNPQEAQDEELNRMMVRGATHDKYHAHLDSIFSDEKALIVKFCDFLDNIITTGFSTNQRLRQECTPRYLPILEKYQRALQDMQRTHGLKSDATPMFFEKIRELFNSN